MGWYKKIFDPLGIMGINHNSIFNRTKKISSEEPRINAITYQQSTFGAVKTILYGTNKISGNIIDSTDFVATPHTETQKSGKGGSSTQTSTTSYTYSARILIALCYGPIKSISKILKNSTETTLTDEGFNVFVGNDSQLPWGEMQTYHPERALSYRHLAYVASNLSLGTSSSVPQYSFEVHGLYTDNTDDLNPTITEGFSFSANSGYLTSCSNSIHYSDYYISDNNVEIVYYNAYGAKKTINNFTNYSKSGTKYTFNISSLNAVSAHIYLTYNSTIRLDANPKDIIKDILTNNIYGAGFSNDNIGDLANYSKYCIANGIFLSPVYNSQTEAQSILSDLASLTNSEFVLSQGKLNIIPVGDEEVTGNGITWTPDLTPIFDLSYDDLLEPVSWARSQQSDVYNSIKLEYLNRANNYNIEIVEAFDLGSIELYGNRPADTMTAHSICDMDLAKSRAQLAVDRLGSIRNTATFKLPIKFIMLDSMDIVSLPTKSGQQPVRILTIKEVDKHLEFEAEEVIAGTTTPAKYTNQLANRQNINLNQKVGEVNPAIIFEPSFELTQNELAIWIGVSGENAFFGGAQVWVSEEDSYIQKGEIKTKCRQGILSTALPASTNETDTNNTLSVDLSMSNSTLLSGSQADADNLNTLCYVDGELLAYQNAILTDSNQYNLTYLNRGAYGTTISKHNANSQFARIDDNVFLSVSFKKEDIGKQLKIKLPSFNVFGGGYQDLSEVEPYYYTIKGKALLEAPADIDGLTDYYTDGLNVITWTASTDSRTLVYEIRKGSSWEQGQQLGRVSANKYTANGNGIYFVKAYIPDYNIYSENAASIEINGARLVQNVIATINEQDLGWQGTKNNIDISNNYIRLASNGIFDNITNFDDVQNLDYYGDLYTEGSYQSNNIIDIGVAASCYVNIDYNFVGDSLQNIFDNITNFDDVQNLDGSYGEFITGSKIQISIAGNDDIFGDWKDFVTGQYFGKKFKFQSVLKSSSNQVIAKMSQFNINVDVPDLVETGNNILIPATGKTILFEKNFHAIPNVQTTILDKNQGDDEFITNLTQLSFDIVIKNNNTAIEKSINFVAQGY